jgi:hypothetical protein
MFVVMVAVDGSLSASFTSVSVLTPPPVDYSPLIVDFLKKYYQSNPGVHVYLNDGYHLPFHESSWIDLVFSFKNRRGTGNIFNLALIRQLRSLS